MTAGSIMFYGGIAGVAVEIVLTLICMKVFPEAAQAPAGGVGQRNLNSSLILAAFAKVLWILVYCLRESTERPCKQWRIYIGWKRKQ